MSNNTWILLVYRDLKPIKEALDNNNYVTLGLQSKISEDNNRKHSFIPTTKLYPSLLNQIY